MTDRPISVRLASAERELAEIASVQEASDLADRAAAAAEFARRAKLSVSAVNHATAIRILAERRMAELVNEGQGAGQIATAATGGGRPSKTSPEPGAVKPATLGELGVDNRRLAEARRLARDYTDDDVRELAAQATDEDRALSRDSLLKSNAQRMQSSESSEWYTPAPYIEAARRVLGAIDLDPASCQAANRTVRAGRFYSADDDGLAQPWKGTVWLNPPYGGRGGSGRFIAKLAGSYAAGDVTAAVCLVSSHSADTEWFRPLWDYLLCFSYGRVPFISSSGNADAPTHGSVFGYLGKDWPAFAAEFGKFGAIVARWRP